MTVLRARADLYGKQIFECTNTANRFSNVQYRCIFVLSFGRYSLQWDNNSFYNLPSQGRCGFSAVCSASVHRIC